MVRTMDNIEMRMKNIFSIKRTLLEEFGNNIHSAIVYGSTLNADFCETSDYDILLIFEAMSMDTLNKIHYIKEKYAKWGVRIDFNSHLLSDLPSERGGLYWHNNRSVFIQQELSMTGYPIIGINPFAGYRACERDMQIEAVRMLNSFVYQARKMIINKDLNNAENRLFLIKWCIYGSLYLLAGKGLFYSSRREGLSQFVKEIESDIDPMCFLHMKIERPEMISNDDIETAYNYLNYLDTCAISMFKHSINEFNLELTC